MHTPRRGAQRAKAITKEQEQLGERVGRSGTVGGRCQKGVFNTEGKQRFESAAHEAAASRLTECLTGAASHT